MIFQHHLILTYLLLSICEAFKILVFYPFPAYSHQRGIMALTQRLVNNGHELFVISPNAVPGLEKHTNYTNVDLSFSYRYVTGDNLAAYDFKNQADQFWKWQLPAVYWEVLAEIVRKQLLSEAYRKFNQRIKSENIKFDLVIIENLFLPYACALTTDSTEAAPIVSMSSHATDDLAEWILGSIEHSSFKPDNNGQSTDRMTLWQKLDSWVSHHYIVSELKKQQGLSVLRYCRDEFGPANENLADNCESRISFSLITSNPMYYPRALGPNAIEIGPLHFKTPEKLPQDLRQWLDGTEQGVIYFSLGSNMKTTSLPENVLANFLKIFAKLQPLGYRVLCKWELDGKIPGQSSNILAQKWIPQESVFAHPKVKIFIMQGGLQSFQESVHYGVPILGIPWLFDQKCNVAKMVVAGIGVQILPKDLYSCEMIKSAIEEVLFNDKYSINMKRHAAISHDFTSRGMDQAVFWVEHVSKHGGASHLRPSTADATLFEYFCLDIISVIVFLNFLSMYLVYLPLRFCTSFISRTFKSKIKSS